METLALVGLAVCVGLEAAVAGRHSVEVAAAPRQGRGETIDI